MYWWRMPFLRISNFNSLKICSTQELSYILQPSILHFPYWKFDLHTLHKNNSVLQHHFALYKWNALGRHHMDTNVLLVDMDYGFRVWRKIEVQVSAQRQLTHLSTAFRSLLNHSELPKLKKEIDVTEQLEHSQPKWLRYTIWTTGSMILLKWCYLMYHSHMSW